MSLNQLEGTLATWIWIQLRQQSERRFPGPHGHSLLVAHSRQKDCRLAFFFSCTMYWINVITFLHFSRKLLVLEMKYDSSKSLLAYKNTVTRLLFGRIYTRDELSIRQTDNSSKYKSEDEFWRIVCLDILRGEQETLRKYRNQSTLIYLETSSKNRLLSV